ncbi:MAG: hypothetical protein NTX85_02635 [Candidatus Nomurabacteria bacterium]|nr:hypothetical protein [Candidatus Nomurabacteria bacterium]
MVKLEIHVTAEGTSSFEFKGTIEIEEGEEKILNLSYESQTNKNVLSFTRFFKDEKLGSLPPSLEREIRKLLILAIEDYRYIRKKIIPKKDRTPAEGSARSSSFKIQKNEWEKFINPEKRKFVGNIQRNSATD